ncbi:MAG: hypothetical protein JSR50_04785 [Proteobacteria bacterium]|nr:hypothetical protein [Pseudomonadota bacterium]
MNDKTRSTRNSGLVFLVVGVVFFATGLATHNAGLWAPGPAFIALGFALMAGARRKPQ